LIDAIATNSFVRVPELRREMGSWGSWGSWGRIGVKLGVTIVLGVNKLGSS
jgi:hypothetical protein